MTRRLPVLGFQVFALPVAGAPDLEPLNQTVTRGCATMMLVGTGTKMMLLTTESDWIVTQGRETPCLAVRQAAATLMHSIRVTAEAKVNFFWSPLQDDVSSACWNRGASTGL